MSVVCGASNGCAYERPLSNENMYKVLIDLSACWPKHTRHSGPLREKVSVRTWLVYPQGCRNLPRMAPEQTCPVWPQKVLKVFKMTSPPAWDVHRIPINQTRRQCLGNYPSCCNHRPLYILGRVHAEAAQFSLNTSNLPLHKETFQAEIQAEILTSPTLAQRIRPQTYTRLPSESTAQLATLHQALALPVASDGVLKGIIHH